MSEVGTVVVAEGQVMDSVSDETMARPKGRELQVGEARQKGDLFYAMGAWEETIAPGAPIPAEFVGRFIRPEPETPAESSPGTAPQPAPTPAPEGSTPVVDLLIATLRERAAAGLRTYGAPLTAHNGRRADIDALQEACDQAMYLRQLVEEIDDVRRVLGASEGETLLAAAERIRTTLRDEDDEALSVADLAARTRAEVLVVREANGTAVDDLTAARARITYLEQHLAGAQRDAKNLRADLSIEREAHEATRRGWLAEKERAETIGAEHKETLARNLALSAEASALRGKIEEIEKERDAATKRGESYLRGAGTAGAYLMAERDDLRAKLAGVEHERDHAMNEADALRARIDARKRMIDALRAKLAEAEREIAALQSIKARRNEALAEAEEQSKRLLDALNAERAESATLIAERGEAEERARRAEAERETILSEDENDPATPCRCAIHRGACRSCLASAVHEAEHTLARVRDVLKEHGFNTSEWGPGDFSDELDEAFERFTDMEARIAGRDAFLARLAHGGRIVSTMALSEASIAVARASDRLRVADDGLGYVYIPGPHEGARTASDIAGLAAREAQEPSREPAPDPECYCGQPRSCHYDESHGFVARPGEPAPVAVLAIDPTITPERAHAESERDIAEMLAEEMRGVTCPVAPLKASEPEALVAFRAWCALDEDDRRDATAWEIAADSRGTAEAAGRALDAIPEVLRLYDEARAEIARLKRDVALRDAMIEDAERRREAADQRASDANAALLRSHGVTPPGYAPSAAPEPVAESSSIDPGEGWRPLKPGEVIAAGDEFSPGQGLWWVSADIGRVVGSDQDELPYRRRIEKPDPVHAPTGDLPPVGLEAPRVEDAAPEVQDATMAPWRGETTVVEDDKGRWVVQRARKGKGDEG